MHFDGWIKATNYFSFICGYSPLNNQVLLYDYHGRNFDKKAMNILWICHIESFVLKGGDSGNYQTNNNGPNLRLKNMYGDSIVN